MGGFLAALLIAAAGLLVLTARPAHAATTFVVNSTADTSDTNTQDNVCDVDASTVGNQCTLRAAIEQANAILGAATIKFNIPGGGKQTISLASPLPAITDRVNINGYSQPGSKANTLRSGNNAVLNVELNGSALFDPFPGGPKPTLALRSSSSSSSSSSVVSGLAMKDFLGHGIEISDDISGVALKGNVITAHRGDGVKVNGTANTIGGTRPKDRNVISGNNQGVEIDSGSGRNQVLGNFIGTTTDGTGNLGNDFNGVTIWGNNSGSSNNSNNVISGNTIAYNGGHGVAVFRSQYYVLSWGEGNRILGNSIFSNGSLGIDLDNDAQQTDNDDQDLDSGPNTLQNFPVPSSATKSDKKTTIVGTLNSTPNTKFIIQFFSNPSGDTDEGKKFIGQKKVTTDANGAASFFFNTKQAPLGEYVTTTATDASGNTSEFSEPVTVA